MKEIETRSTSLKTAECTPIVLRQSEQVRLVFLPTLVENAATPEACVRGHFVYQRKTKREGWVSVTTVPLSSLKSGEGFKLELHSEELLALVKGIGPLYRLYRQQGIPRGQTTFVRLEAGLARFLTLGEPELTAFLEAHTDDAATTLLKLVKWLASSPQAGETASRIAAISPEKLPSFTALLGLATLKNALAYWKQHQSNSSEEFWQQALADRAYVLGQVFAYPLVVIGSKAYVGGKQVTNKGGNVIDFLAAIESTDAVVLIEIKTPQSKVLGRAYRENVFPLSTELSGAIAQILTYRQSLMREFYSVTAAGSKQLTLGEPRCLIIAGNATNELTNRPMRESFEMQRERLQGVAIITYDELFRRLERLVILLEGSSG